MSNDSIYAFDSPSQLPEQDTEFIFDDSVRRLIIDGKVYYSIFDIYRYSGRTTNVRHNWSRDIEQLAKQNFDPTSTQVKYSFPDKRGIKNRATPMLRQDTIDQIRQLLGKNWPKPKFLNHVEVDQLHPHIGAKLEQEGYLVSHHFTLDSGKIIDFVAKKENTTLLIECKNMLIRSELFNAIGQVLCYCIEYGNDAIPTIAYPNNHISEYAIYMCEALHIKLIAIQM